MNVIRLYDEMGNHKLSIVPCADIGTKNACYDLARPDGKVVYCGIDADLLEVFETWFKIERIDS